MRRAAAALLAAGLLWVPLALGSSLNLTEEERGWIAANPVVRMAADLSWKPIQFVKDNRIQGLTSEYVAAVERLTGLRFELTPVTDWDTAVKQFQQGELDVVPGVLRAFITPTLAELVTLTRSYFVTTTIVVTREQGPVIFDLGRLDGQVIAFRGGERFIARIKSLYPGIKILATRTSEEALEAVAEGKAIAALDAQVVFLPYLRRKYDGILHVSGVVSSLPIELAMGVRSDLPILHGIIDKALASLTARETDEMDARWFQEADYGAPSVPVMIRYYGPQIALAGAGLLLIAGFALAARRQKRRAESSEKEKTMFLAVLSHEIRSPMNAIIASMELLTRHTQLPPEPRRLLGVAVSGAENLLRLLDDVLDISKLEAGRLQLDPSPVDIVELLRKTTDLQQFAAREKGISLELKEEVPAGCRLMLDPLRVGQILQNLISNAIKFTLQGGVTVGVRFRKPSSESEKGLLQIRIEDTGIGMDEAARKRLFQPYAQASASTAGKFGGTGLGLSICRQLAELMGGTISVESEPGRGSVFTVRLPCDLYAVKTVSSDHSISHAPSAGARTASDAQPPNVLLVEDMPANQMVLQAQLAALGCRSTLAPSGEDALKALEQARYDIVLLDCDLPGISGYDVARQWRAIESSRGIPPTPMLAISASIDNGHTAACFEAGMDGVLSKPIKLGKLRDALQLWSDTPIVESGEKAHVVANIQEAWAAMRADLQALRSAIEAGDAAAAAHFAHRLTGACAALEQEDMAALARSLETQFKTDFPGPVREILAQLERGLDQGVRSTLQ